MPVALNTLSAAAPHGTCTAQSAIFLFLSAKSFRPVILPGLPFGTAISRVLLTKLVGVPLSFTSPMFFGAAEAKTSAGAPSLICLASAELPAKLKVTFVPGCAASKSLPSWVNVPVSDAAANTVMVPDTVGVLLELLEGADDAAGLSSPQPAMVRAATVARAASAVRRNIRPPGFRRRHGWT